MPGAVTGFLTYDLFLWFLVHEIDYICIFFGSRSYQKTKMRYHPSVPHPIYGYAWASNLLIEQPSHGLLYLQDGKLFDVVYLKGEKRQILAMQLNGFTLP